MKRSDVFRVAVAGLALVFPLASAAMADDVRVRVPQGVDYADSTTSAAPNGGLFVTVTGLAFRNATGLPQSYRATDLHLIANGVAYTPVVRPKLGAIDTIENGIVGPNEILRLSVTFRVPEGTSRGDVEFTPHWLGDNGRTLDFCCYYL